MATKRGQVEVSGQVIGAPGTLLLAVKSCGLRWRLDGII